MHVHGYTNLEGLTKAAKGERFMMVTKGHVLVREGKMPFHISAPVGQVLLDVDRDDALWVEPVGKEGIHLTHDDCNILMHGLQGSDDLHLCWADRGVCVDCLQDEVARLRAKLDDLIAQRMDEAEAKLATRPAEAVVGELQAENRRLREVAERVVRANKDVDRHGYSSLRRMVYALENVLREVQG